MRDEVREQLLLLLEEGRRMEKGRTVMYRTLASLAEDAGEAETAASDRLNALHADEQHHLSRLTARLLELGVTPEELPRGDAGPVVLEGWEAVARVGEAEEIAWYEAQVAKVQDPETARILREILDSERFHLTNLAGKWMPA